MATDAIPPEASLKLLEQIDPLCNELSALKQKLEKEKETNTSISKEVEVLVARLLEWTEARNKYITEIGAVESTRVSLQKAAAQFQKNEREIHDFIARLQCRIEEIRQENRIAQRNLRTHTKRVSLYHARLSAMVAPTSVLGEIGQAKARLQQLEEQNKQLRLERAQYDNQLLKAVAEKEAETKELALELADAQARLNELKSRRIQQHNVGSIQENQLKKALEVQLATNATIEASIQASEFDLFGGLSSGRTHPNELLGSGEFLEL